MELTKYSLVKGTARCVIQGMIHAGSAELFASLQQQMDEAVVAGAVIFKEGVIGTWKEFVPKNEAEVFAARVLGWYIRGLNIVIEKLGTSQRQHIRYPENCTQADASFAELVRNFISKKIEVPEDMASWLSDSDESIEKQFHEAAERIRVYGLINVLSQKSENPRYWKLLDPIVVEYRNTVVVRHIQDWIDANPEGYAFVHYGENHLEGIVSLLQEDGWSTKEVSHLKCDI